jgi:hypothetical protein
MARVQPSATEMTAQTRSVREIREKTRKVGSERKALLDFGSPSSFGTDPPPFSFASFRVFRGRKSARDSSGVFVLVSFSDEKWQMVFMNKQLLVAGCVWLFAAASLRAQFAGAFVKNDKYWNDGKAEFDIYDAKIVRYGQPRDTEVIHIFVREPFDARQFVKADKPDKPGVISVLKLNQIVRVPTGIYVYQQMHSNFWRVDDARLIKFSLTSSDSCGNSFKLGTRNALFGGWRYHFHTYWDGMAEGDERIGAPANGYFYDELPMRVRTIDFSKNSGEFAIKLARTMIHSKKGSMEFKPAKVSFKAEGKQIVVNVAHADGADQFTLGAEFPHLMEAWKMADGGELKLKHSLKIDYWRYHFIGDKERALADPAMRLK